MADKGDMEQHRVEPGRFSRLHTGLLAAVACLFVVDVASRTSRPAEAGAGEAVLAEAQFAQPGVMTNPADQRRRIIAELEGIDRRLASIEKRLDSKLRVEVMNFPKPQAEKD